MTQVALFDLGPDAARSASPARRPPTALRNPVHLWYPKELLSPSDLIPMFEGEQPMPPRFVCVWRSDSRRMPDKDSQRGTLNPDKVTCQMCERGLAERPQLRNALVALVKKQGGAP